MSRLERTPQRLEETLQGVVLTSDFTEAQLKLLSAHNIRYLDSTGEWVHIDKRSDGSALFAPADPQQELMMIQRELQGQAIMDTLGDGMIRTRVRVFGITFIINRPDVSSKIQR